MKKLLLILLCLPMIGFGQEWIQNYIYLGDGSGSCVQQTVDEGYIISGSTKDDGRGNILLIKTDEFGDTLWTKIFNDTGYGHWVKELVNGEYIIVGGGTTAMTTGGNDIKLIKTDEFGDTLWTKTITNPLDQMAYSIDETNDSSYIITGREVQGAGIILLKIDNNGNTLWNQTHSFGHSGYEVKTDNDGNFIICGSSQSISNGWDALLFKTNQNGDTIWTQTYGGSGHEVALGFDQTNDGGFIICGRTSDSLFLLKTDSLGELIWQKSLGGNNDDYGEKIKQTIDGGYIIVGHTRSFGVGDYDIWLIKTDSVGDTLWTKTFVDSINNGFGYSVIQTSDNEYVITGRIDGGICLIKTNVVATPTWECLNNTCIDPGTGSGQYSTQASCTAVCGVSAIQEHTTSKELHKVTDLLGRETKNRNQPLLYLYDDGTVEKRIVIE